MGYKISWKEPIEYVEELLLLRDIAVGNVSEPIDTSTINEEKIVQENQALKEELNRIYNSKGWNALQKLYRIKDKLIPKDSFRYMIVRGVYHFFRFFNKVIRNFNSKNAQKFIYAVKYGGMGYAISKIKNSNDSNFREEKKNEFLYIKNEEIAGKKKLLLINDKFPEFDQNAGAKTLDAFLMTFIELNFDITFIACTDSMIDNKYSKRLKDRGISLVSCYGEDKYLIEWLRENVKKFDYILLSRPFESRRYIDTIKNTADKNIIYFAHDLYSVRLQREYYLTKEKDIKNEAEMFQEIEHYIMKNVKRILLVSENEKMFLEEEFREKAVIIPAFAYETNAFKNDYIDYEEKKDLLFVGNFQHRPNEDGIKWFLENIYEKVLDAIPEANLNIVGINPPRWINTHSNVTLLGYKTEEELEDLYIKAKICIVPLRFGAGIKGKVLEAMSYGKPIVSTSIGLEGLEKIEKYLRPYDTDEDFAKEIIRLYNDKNADEKAASNCEYISENFSHSTLKESFSRFFSLLDAEY